MLTGEEILDSGVQVDRAAAGQAQHVDPPAVRRREGADGDFAGVRAVPAESGAVLPARRGRRAARRPEHRPLLQDGAARCRGETQFLFISHNKITMEMANQLIGITMPEPGVSRVVAVDIAEALELAEAA